MRVKGPMFSLEASGTVGGVITASKWKGRPYFRTTVTPSNPRSGAQTGTRAMFAFLGSGWADLTLPEQATWEPLGAQNAFSPFNGYQQFNMRRWTQYTAPQQDATTTPTNSAGTIDASVIAAGVRQATIEIELGNAGTNWGIVLHRNSDDTLTPTTSNTVKSIQATGNDTFTIVDTPLEAGDYGYVARAFSDDGTWGTAVPLGNLTIT